MMEVKPVFQDGAMWYLFGVEYIHDESRWEFHIRAKDWQDAQARAKSIMDTARVVGQITDIINEDEILE